MDLTFYKYQGTGNDFVMIDGRELDHEFTNQQIQQICDRRFGVGADGVIILKKHAACDFEMDYYNADGSQSFCGNGSRCAQAFAKKLGMVDTTSYFKAIDGFHKGKSIDELFATKMGDVGKVEQIGSDFFIHTGSPHYIKYVANVEEINVLEEGSSIRNSEAYKEEGTNVNFVSIESDHLSVRTFERGVEGETFSCGTGVTAVAISYLVKAGIDSPSVAIRTKGGKLQIDLEKVGEEQFKNIWLIGPVVEVYSGKLEL